MMRSGRSLVSRVALAVAFVLCMTLSGIAGATQLRVATWGGLDELATYRQIISAFEKLHPDIQISLEPVGWGEYSTRTLLQLASGVGPDVMRLSGAFSGQFIAQGALLNLQPLIDRDALNIDDVFLSDRGIFVHDGDRYALHDGGDIIALYYNIDLFDRTGVAYPTASWSWDDLFSSARKLTYGQADDVQYWGMQMLMHDMQSYWYNYLLQNGTAALNPGKTATVIDSPQAIEALEFMNSFFQHYLTPLPGQFDGDPFREGRVAMTNRLTPLNINSYSDVGFVWDMAPLPRGKQRASQTNWVGWGINKDSKEAEAAWAFVQFMVEEGSYILASTRQGLPSLREAVFSTDFLRPSADGPQRLAETLDFTLPYTHDLQFTNTWWEWTGIIQRELYQVALGNKSVLQAVQTAAPQVNALLAEENKR